MSSAICLIDLATEYSWAFLLVSAFRQPHRRQAAASKVRNKIQPSSGNSFHPLPRDLQITHLFLERKNWWLFLKLTIASCPNLCGVHEEQRLLLALMFSVGTLWSRGSRKEEGEQLQLFCCAHLLSLTPPGTCSDLCGDLTPSLLSLLHFLSAPRRPHQIPSALQEIFGRPPSQPGLV